MTLSIQSGSTSVATEHEQVLRQMECVAALLTSATNSLCEHDLPSLPDPFRELASAAGQLQSLLLSLAPAQWCPDVDLRRRKLLADLVQQRALYVACLRRWRRSLQLRRHLLEMHSDAACYGDTMATGEY